MRWYTRDLDVTHVPIHKSVSLLNNFPWWKYKINALFPYLPVHQCNQPDVDKYGALWERVKCSIWKVCFEFDPVQFRFNIRYWSARVGCWYRVHCISLPDVQPPDTNPISSCALASCMWYAANGVWGVRLCSSMSGSFKIIYVFAIRLASSLKIRTPATR